VSSTGSVLRRGRGGGSGAQREDRSQSLLGGLVRTARPKQWIKNVLVVAAPLASGRLGELDVLLATLLAFACLCLAASGTYFLNDAKDVDADRLHPTKRNRPIAAGAVPLPVAKVASAVLMAAGIGLAVLGGPALVAVVAAYVALTVSYTLVFKHEPLLDLVAVAGGFVLRAVAGAAAADIPVSRWFLIVATFGSLFMVAGKRYSEFLLMGEDRATTRASLANYSLSYLHFVWTAAAVITLIAYCLYAFEVGEAVAGLPWAELSTLPFVVAILRYALVVDRGEAGAPEEVVLGDRHLQLLGLAWLVLFTTGVVLA
jgi:decaprenyl-phosphate phosphoribosyltransferase